MSSREVRCRVTKDGWVFEVGEFAAEKRVGPFMPDEVSVKEVAEKLGVDVMDVVTAMSRAKFPGRPVKVELDFSKVERVAVEDISAVHVGRVVVFRAEASEIVFRGAVPRFVQVGCGCDSPPVYDLTKRENFDILCDYLLNPHKFHRCPSCRRKGRLEPHTETVFMDYMRVVVRGFGVQPRELLVHLVGGSVERGGVYDFAGVVKASKKRLVVLALKAVPAEVSEAERSVEEPEVPAEHVEELAHDPAFIYKLGQAIEAAGVVGEEENKRLVWLIVVSGRTRYPRSCVLEGPSRSGKNHIVYVVLEFVPREWVFEFTTATAEAIKYLPETARVTLVIYEAAGIRSQTGALGLRAIGEARQIATIYPVRDESTGRIRLEMHKTGARNFVTTTTAVDVEPELLGRTIAVGTDYSKELTKKVVKKHIRDAVLKPLFDAVGETPYAELRPEEVRALLRSLDLDLPVVVCAPDITPLFDHLPPELFVTLREHYETLLDIARVLALVRQKMRPILEIGDKRVVLALPQDVLDAWILVGGQLAKTVERMSRRAEAVLRLAEELDDGDGFTIRDITARTGMPRRSAQHILDQLVARGFLRVEKAPGKANVYYYEKEAQTPGKYEFARLAVSAFRKGLETLLSEGWQGGKLRGIGGVCIPPDVDMDVWVHPVTGESERLPVSEMVRDFAEALREGRAELCVERGYIGGIPLSLPSCHPSENQEKDVKEAEKEEDLANAELPSFTASLVEPTLGECERAVLGLMHRKRLEGVEWLYEHEIMESLGDRFGELLIRGALDALVRAGKLIREETPEGVRYRLVG